MWKKTFAVLRISTNHESFPYYFISAILSADVHSKSYFHAYQKQNCESFPYIINMIKSNKTKKLFSHVTFVVYGIWINQGKYKICISTFIMFIAM